MTYVKFLGKSLSLHTLIARHFRHAVTHFFTLFSHTQIFFYLEVPTLNITSPFSCCCTYVLNYYFCCTSLLRVLIFHTSSPFALIWRKPNRNICTLLLLWIYLTSHTVGPLFVHLTHDTIILFVYILMTLLYCSITSHSLIVFFQTAKPSHSRSRRFHCRL